MNTTPAARELRRFRPVGAARRAVTVGAGLLALSVMSGVAHAHIKMTSPKPRWSDQKYGPCGRSGAAGLKRSTNVTTFKPGETIKVTWQETIGHPGHFRIAFDVDGTDGFIAPKSATDFNNSPEVLVDKIADKSGTMTYSQEITFPDVECDNCTLQLIQAMTDKAPFGNGDDIYFQCADIVLSAAGAGGMGGAAGGGGAGGGGSGGAGGAGGGMGGAGGSDADGGSSDGAAGQGGTGGDEAGDSSGGCAIAPGVGGGLGVALAAMLGLAGIGGRRKRRGRD